MTAIAQCGNPDPELAFCTLPFPSPTPFDEVLSGEPEAPDVALAAFTEDKEAETEEEEAAADADDMDAITEFGNVVSMGEMGPDGQSVFRDFPETRNENKVGRCGIGRK